MERYTKQRKKIPKRKLHRDSCFILLQKNGQFGNTKPTENNTHKDSKDQEKTDITHTNKMI